MGVSEEEANPPGSSVTIDGRRFTVVGRERLRASPTSGVAEGDYLVVYELVGERKAYRAVVDGTPYPIRQYGTPDAVIAKQRESRGEPRAARATTSAPPSEPHADSENIELSHEAVEILEQYVKLKRGGDQGTILSDLVVQHLGPEVERLKRAQQAIQQLPVDLLTRLADASAEQREQILAMLVK